MRLVAFASRRLPGEQDRRLRGRLAEQHEAEPFTPHDTRATVRRVVQVGSRLGMSARMFRGGLDLHGIEVDHVWASLDGVVVDAAFPLLDEGFVEVLRLFVAGDAEMDDLVGAADGSDLTRRIIGEFPAPLRYVGCPVWTERHRSSTG